MSFSLIKLLCVCIEYVGAHPSFFPNLIIQFEIYFSCWEHLVLGVKSGFPGTSPPKIATTMTHDLVQLASKSGVFNCGMGGDLLNFFSFT